MSEWLNNSFATFDGACFNVMNGLAKCSGGFFTPFFKFVSFFGEGGIFFIILSLVLMLFQKTRKHGFTMLVAIGVGALFTNVIIKNAVARPRPFNASEEYRAFWEFVSAKEQSEYSFPSGHTTATMACMTALFWCANKKFSWLGMLFALVMAISRVYLIVHYATDVIAGLVIGAIAGTVAYFIFRCIYKKLRQYSSKPFCDFLLNKNVFGKSEK